MEKEKNKDKMWSKRYTFIPFNETDKEAILINPQALENDYIPPQLPHRERALSILCQLFLPVILNPKKDSRTVLITGPSGCGKTALIILFRLLLTSEIQERHLNIQIITINCKRKKTIYKVLLEIVTALQPSFPKRGFSPQELLKVIFECSQKKEIHIIVLLDDIDYLSERDLDLIYSLTHYQDNIHDTFSMISIVEVSKENMLMSEMYSDFHCLQRERIELRPYSIEEICDILSYRVQLSFKKDLISDELLETIATLLYDKESNIRYGLQLIRKAWKLAVKNKEIYLTQKYINLAVKAIIPYSIKEYLKYASKSKLLFLLAIIRGSEHTDRQALPLSDIMNDYKRICEHSIQQRRSTSQLWNYLHEFETTGIITIHVRSKNIRGRRAMIKIPFAPDELKTQVQNQLS
jgi:cell division control protein 6